MEVHINVWGENPLQQRKYKSKEAYFTFVGLDLKGKSQEVPAVIPETEEENKLYTGALRRRQVRLVLSGKMKPEDAGELKAFLSGTVV